MPRLIDFDPGWHTLVLEDLGVAADYTDLYRAATLHEADAATLAHWLSRLHSLCVGEADHRRLSNLPLRRLNHEHVFRLPLVAQNGLDLDVVTPGLREVADGLAEDRALVAGVVELGELYLAEAVPRASLLHGDFFPGSWLRTDSGPAVIDPEFAFFGPAEWDVGVMLAHLRLASQPRGVLAAVESTYGPPDGFSWALAERFAAVEVIRRLIGVAQLPLGIGLDAKRDLLAGSAAILLA
jgi:5-methylthioribose kinase